MGTSSAVHMRKRLLSEEIFRCRAHPGEINIASLATFNYSSEDPDCPLEHLVDGHDGPGGTRWASAQANTTAYIELAFDPAQHLSHLVYQVEECVAERTQEVRVEVSSDHGASYRYVLIQEYTFSPQGATFQHEDLRLDLQAVTHLRLTIVPNKRGSGVATLTCLQLFGPPL